MKPSIQAKIISTSASNFIVSYNDDGSGADCDVQFWNPRPLDPDFRPAGDVCEASPSDWIYDTPNPRGQIALLAPIDGIDGMLASPTGFTRVWDDAGSGVKKDGTIWQMMPPSGFVALGHVITMGDPTPEPDPTNYWCISKKLVIAAEEGAQIWNDLKSSAKTDVGIWRLVTTDSARFVDLNTFFATLSHEPGQIQNAFVLDPAAVQWVS